MALVAFAAFFSPLTSNIYYPAVNDMARDLQVSSTAINFSFTSYMVRQPPGNAFGWAPPLKRSRSPKA